MPAAIDFWFDFSSPYGYLASRRIEAIAARHGRSVRWRPIMLGVVFQKTGQTPLLGQPLRGPYFAIDMPRSARLHGIEFKFPEPFPFASVAACRAFYWFDRRDGAAAVDFAKAVYRRAFIEGHAVGDAGDTAAVAKWLGHDPRALLDALQDPQVKEWLREVMDEALERGVFGSPFFHVDGEPFWGHDRLEQVDRWLATGGW